MKEPRHDDERLSALLAGRLTGPERDELLAHLSTSEEDADVAINAAAILREMEEEDAEAAAGGAQHASPPQRDVMPPSVQKRARGWPRNTPRWAGTLVIAGLVVLGSQAARGGAPGPLRVAAALSESRQLPPGREDSLPPGNTRGEGELGSLERGVYLMRLIVSVQAEDSAQTMAAADRLSSLVGGQASVLDEIRGRAGDSPESMQPLLAQASDRVEALSEPDYVRLGAWIEAAHLAVARRDAAFFSTRDTRAMLRRADRMTRGNDEAQRALSEVRGAIPADGAPNWDMLDGTLDELFRRAGS